MKKIVIFLLALVISFTGCFGQSVIAAELPDDELARIKTYKLFDNSVFKHMDEPMTDKVYYSAIKKYIKPYGSNAQKKFDKEIKSSLNDGNTLTYQDLFFLTYLTAYATDTAKLTQGYSEDYIYRLVESERYWYQRFKCNETYTESGKGNYISYEPWGGLTRFASPDDLIAESVFFVLLQTSQVSGAALYDVKNDTCLKMFSAKCPSDVAVRMLGRLYETTKPVKWSEKSKNFKNVHNEIESKRNAILNSESDYPEGRKTYYVSTSGDDSNDGLSEETPWRSLMQVSGGLEPGSVVLLKRGDIWKGECLSCQAGVTYSAYGEGEKPTIYGDAEDADNPDNWILCDELSNGKKKIWKYKNELFDIGGIIFDGGDSYATRIYGWWRDSKWVDFYDVKKELTPSYALKEDLTFISLPDLTGLSYPIRLGPFNETKGPLYFRCDKGNPADIYDEIHFEQGSGSAPVLCFENSTVDNIAVKYFGELGITSIFSDEETEGMSLRGVTVTNCEVGFGGNVYLCFPSDEPDLFASSTGDGIYGICNGAVIKNNYIHDVDCNAIRVENSGKMCDRNIDDPMLIDGNLCERNGAGIWLETCGGKVKYKSITIKDNMVVNNGLGWVHGGGCGFVGISTSIAALNECKNITIKDNIVYNTPYAVYDCWGKSIKTSGNRFYMASYSTDTVIKKGIIYVLNRKKKTATAVDTVQGDSDSSFTVPKVVKVGKVSYKVTKRYG